MYSAINNDILTRREGAVAKDGYGRRKCALEKVLSCVMRECLGVMHSHVRNRICHIGVAFADSCAAIVQSTFSLALAYAKGVGFGLAC